MTQFLKLFSTSLLLLSTASCLPLFGLQPTAGNIKKNSFELFSEREVISQENALLRHTQQQIAIINSNPEAKLAYLRSMRQSLDTKSEIAQIQSLPPEQRANAIERLYAQLRAENQYLMVKQQAFLPRSSNLPGLPNFTAPPQQAQGQTVEASMMDIAAYYKQQRRRATSPTIEVGPNDFRASMLNRRTQNISGPPEVSPSQVRSFMQQTR